jgi:hypothetical protein
MFINIQDRTLFYCDRSYTAIVCIINMHTQPSAHVKEFSPLRRCLLRAQKCTSVCENDKLK